MKMLRHIGALLFLSCCWACLDEFEISTLEEDGQSGLLVVEAVLTNEVITQKVYLSRSDNRLDLETDTVYSPYTPLGNRPMDSVNWEEGATVTVQGSNGTAFSFTEGQSGFYFSNEPFALQMGVNYTLEITTSGGTDYMSDPVAVQGTSKVTNVYAERAISGSGVEGVAIYVDSEPLEGKTEYYRYAYEETYKVVAPYWQPVDFELTGYDNSVYPPAFNLDIVERQIQNRICYNTVSSNTIEQFSTAGNPEREIFKHMVRFIGKDNFIISNRYSILVQQQVQSVEAYSFYKTLKSFSQSDNIFSEVQPGALLANVYRKDGVKESVLGFVEAVGVSEQRLFFNFDDYFSDMEIPEFPFNCNLSTARIYNEPPPPSCPQDLLSRLDNGIVTYYGLYEEGLVPNASCPGPYVFVPRICGDCTLMGSNVKPDFWID